MVSGVGDYVYKPPENCWWTLLGRIFSHKLDVVIPEIVTGVGVFHQLVQSI
jgi:hypothetical protein